MAISAKEQKVQDGAPIIHQHQPIAVMPPSRTKNPTFAMPLIEDLSRNGIEDCFYSPEAQKSNAYSISLSSFLPSSCKTVRYVQFLTTYIKKDNLEQYFYQKLNYGRQLGLSPQLILEGLTDGMPTSSKQLMTVNPPTSPTEWLMVATRLMKTQAPKPE
ncbi:uncharacterized protein TNCV_2199631 [Trichonephila clavipes]|nr:uncharacterized protein TNCV_2199631 [Trichonephila clavipes]